MENKAKELYTVMKGRRTCRFYKKTDIPLDEIKDCIKIAGTAPNGANMQPWHFVLITDVETRKKIREEAEIIEKKFYEEKISDEWRKDLKPLKTTAEKPFLSEAPCLICVFLKKYSFDEKGNKKMVYYPSESVGIATGFLITALHLSGFSTLTYTSSSMSYLSDILDRPENEKPYMILPVGYGDKQNIEKRDRKPLEDILTVI